MSIHNRKKSNITPHRAGPGCLLSSTAGWQEEDCLLGSAPPPKFPGWLHNLQIPLDNAPPPLILQFPALPPPSTHEALQSGLHYSELTFSQSPQAQSHWSPVGTTSWGISSLTPERHLPEGSKQMALSLQAVGYCGFSFFFSRSKTRSFKIHIFNIPVPCYNTQSNSSKIIQHL